MRNARFFVLLALGVSVAAQGARAAQLAKVGDGVNLFETPRESSRVIRVIPKGVPFAISNLPVEGYYRARMSDGEIGWVKSDSVYLIKRPVDNDPLIGTKPGKIEETFSEVSFHVLGGMTVFNPRDFTQALGITEIPAASYIAGELQFGLASDFFLLARLEYVWKKALATDPNNGSSLSLSFNAMPVHVGFQWNFVKEGDFILAIKLMGGVSISNQIYFGTTQFYKSLAFGGMGFGLFEYNLSESVFIAGEAGYRFLQIPAEAASISGNSSLGAQSLSMDWSGFTFGGGVGLRF